MWQSIIKAWGNKRVDPGGGTRRKRGGGIEREYTVIFEIFWVNLIVFMF